jgi:hypothetical protein
MRENVPGCAAAAKPGLRATLLQAARCRWKGALLRARHELALG